MSPHVCLIGGTGRSGTTVMAEYFGTHPDVALVTELRLLIDPDGLLDVLTLADNWSPAHVDMKLRRLRALIDAITQRSPVGLALSRLEQTPIGQRAPVTIAPQYANRGADREIPDFAALCAAFVSELTDFVYPGKWVGMPSMSRREQSYMGPATRAELVTKVAEFLHRITTAATNASGATHYLEKNTHNILWFDQILEVMPTAKLVHIVRDPRDSAASMLRESWAPSEPDQVVDYLIDLHQRWDLVAARVPKDSYIEVRLEDLVTDRSATTDQIGAFWQLDSWPSQRFDLSRSNSGRWRSDPTIADHPALSRLDHIAENYSYQPIGSARSDSA